MGPSDIDFAMRMTGLEGWGFVRRDFRRLLSLTPGGSFIACKGGRRAGLLTTICQGHTCWIGNVVVNPAFRGTGIGRALVHASIEHSRDRGIMNIGLISRANTVHFYEGLGFRKGQILVGLGGVPKRQPALGKGNGVVPISKELLPKLIRFDERAVGENRGPLLARFSRDFHGHFLVFVDGGDVKVFIVGKPGTTGLDVGPWECAAGNRKAARELFIALVARWQGPVDIYVPRRARWAISFLRRAGLAPVNRFVEMIHGRRRRPASKEDVLSPAGLEKG